MKKTTFYILSIVAGIALAGLIVVQTYWINHAYTIKEQQFSQLVSATINFIATDVQTYEAVQVINKMEAPCPVQRNIRQALIDTSTVIKQQFEFPLIRVSNVDKEITDDERNAFWNNTLRNFSQPDGFSRQSIMQFNAQFNGGESSVQISASSFTMMPQLMSPEERRARRQLLNEIIDARLQQTDLRLEDRIDGETLDHFIRLEMEKSKIDMPFEYAVFAKENNEIIYHSGNFNPKRDDKIFRASLFPFDYVEINPYYLNIYFPQQSNYLFKTIGFMGVSSISFTLIVILTFAVTLYQMQRQKKITSIRTEFVNNVTHELKTPISTISLASQMLNDKSIPNESKNYDHISAVIGDESKRLSQQVEKILQMAIFDSGKLMIKFKKIDVNELANVVVRNMLIQVKNKNGKIIKELDATNAVCDVDEVHFTNVLFNLIDNAIKYSKGRPEITVSTADTPNGLSVSIKDKGVGISKSDQKRIFDQFYRVSTGNVHNVKGFGLGLAYVKNVVKAHNGTVDIDSEPGQGTRFTIFLKHKQSV